MVDWEKWNTLADRAKSSLVGKVLIAAGYEPFHTGGGCAAWRKILPDGTYVLIGDGHYGLGSHVADPESYTWGVGLYTGDVRQHAEDDAIGLKAAIAWGDTALADPEAILS